MSVVELDWQSPHVVALMTWHEAPDYSFRLHFNRWGDLEGFSAFRDAGPEGGGLRARDLRHAPIGEMQRVFLAYLTKLRATFTEMPPERLAKLREASPEMMDSIAVWAGVARNVFLIDVPTTATGSTSPLYKYASIAAKYLELHERGEASPVQVLAEAEGLSPRTVRNYLFQAREKHLLTTKGRGVAGGQLTDEAKEILRGQH